MGIFSGVKKFVGGITGSTASKAAERAGKTQADAYYRGLQMQQRELPRALREVSRGAGEAEAHIRPFKTVGYDATRQLAGLLSRPAPGYRAPTAEEVAASPAVQFRMQQAQRALETGAAARGGLFGGGHQRQLAQYMQGLASQEYESEDQRRLREAEFEQEQLRQRMAGLGGLGELGFRSAGAISALRERLGASMAGLRTGMGAAGASALQAAGQARASGALAGSQAKQQAFGNLMKLGGTLGAAYMTGGASLFGGLGGEGAGTAGGLALQGAPASLGYQPSILSTPRF